MQADKHSLTRFLMVAIDCAVILVIAGLVLRVAGEDAAPPAPATVLVVALLYWASFALRHRASIGARAVGRRSLTERT